MQQEKIKWAVIQPLIGGMAIGAHQAIGTLPEFIMSYSSLKTANDSHILNYWPTVPYISLESDNSFSTIEDETLFNTLNRNIDIVVGVPICTGLSTTVLVIDSVVNADRSQSYRAEHSEKNDNMLNVTDIVLDKIKPKVFVFENAVALFTNVGKPVANKLKKVSSKYEYSLELYRTNTLLHGIPQNRKRTFAYFIRNDDATKKVYSLNFHKADTQPILDFFDSFPTIDNDKLDYEWPAYDYTRSKKIFFDYLQHKFGDNWADVVQPDKDKLVHVFVKFLPEHNLLQDFIQYAREHNAPNLQVLEHKVQRLEMKLDKDLGSYDYGPVIPKRDHISVVVYRTLDFCNKQNSERGYSIRECMRLMGMPDDFVLLGDIKGKHYLSHIGQNVPVCTAKDIVLNAVEIVMNRAEVVSDCEYAKIDNINQKSEYHKESKSFTLDLTTKRKTA